MDDQEKLLRQYIQAVWQKKNPAAVDRFLAPDYVRYRSPLQPPLDRESQRELIASFQTAFPDAELTIEEIISLDGRLVFRSTMRASHQGAFLAIPPTGSIITVTLLDLLHIEDNLFVKQWGGPDLLDLVMQLGGTIVPK